MKLKVHVFKDGRQSFSTDNMEVEINSQLPEIIHMIEISDQDAHEIITNPVNFTFNHKTKKIELAKQKHK